MTRGDEYLFTLDAWARSCACVRYEELGLKGSILVGPGAKLVSDLSRNPIELNDLQHTLGSEIFMKLQARGTIPTDKTHVLYEDLLSEANSNPSMNNEDIAVGRSKRTHSEMKKRSPHGISNKHRQNQQQNLINKSDHSMKSMVDTNFDKEFSDIHKLKDEFISHNNSNNNNKSYNNSNNNNSYNNNIVHDDRDDIQTHPITQYNINRPSKFIRNRVELRSRVNDALTDRAVVELETRDNTYCIDAK